MLKKEARQKVIIDLIENNDIATQEELCELLEKEIHDMSVRLEDAIKHV